MRLMDRTDGYLRDGYDIGHAIAYAVQDEMQRDLDVYEGVYSGADD
jgi:hypothetical protein